MIPLRPSEWLSISFFAYVALLTPFVHNRPTLRYQPVLVLIAVTGAYSLLGLAERRARIGRVFDFTRDWIPIGTTLVAFREMDLFRPDRFPHHWEPIWQAQDHLLLDHLGLSKAVEFLGATVPFYLETCYLLVYGTAAICVWLLYRFNERQKVDRFYLIYLAGTLGAYALFPFFPSEAPRLIYPQELMPDFPTWMRGINLLLLRKATIHVAVFPSAHVSSAFSAAWAMFLLMPKYRWVGWIALAYALSVAIATIYGRYHYAADAVAGLGVSVAAAACYACGRNLWNKHTKLM